MSLPSTRTWLFRLLVFNITVMGHVSLGWDSVWMYYVAIATWTIAEFELFAIGNQQRDTDD